MRTQTNIQKSFNKAGASYDQHCQLQTLVGNHLIQQLINHNTLFASPPNIIDLGCGTGTVSLNLATQLPHHAYHAIDFADCLLTLAKTKLNPLGCQVYQANFENLTCLNTNFDLAFSNMALHWSRDLSTTLKNIATHLNTSGVLAFSIPMAGSLQELAPVFSVNTFFDTDSILQQLTDNGYQPLTHEQQTITLTFNNTLSALRSIKQVGANTTTHPNPRGLRGKSLLNQPNIHTLTYKIGYFIAKKDPTCPH